MVTSIYPKTLEEAIAAKAQNPSLELYAGGTDWMVNRRDNAPLLFLNYIPALKEIHSDADALYIGACCTYTQLLESNLVPKMLNQAVIQVASPAIRNLGTIGGNICNASPAGDTLPVLYTMDARVRLVSARGSREIPLASFIKAVRKTDFAPDELLQGIVLPKTEFTRTYYKKVGARNAVAISKASFAAAILVENGKVAAIPMSFGSVAPTIVRKPDIEATLIGKTLEEITVAADEIVRQYEPFVTPIDDQRSTAAYRKQVCLGLLKDFLTDGGA
jgi:xanthine dehydrogenase FAD-binding subunit